MSAIAIGARLGHYELGEPIGQGGMGAVYRAHDTRLGRNVAVKVLRERLASDPDARARFEREARAAAALSHPNILAIYDFGIAGDTPYSVTELLEGETLRARLAGGPLPWRAAAEVGAAIADGLASAHARNIVHRDVKPENIFLTRDDRVKLLDFGLARGVGSVMPAGPAESPTTLETQAGLVLGTIGYLAPEQVTGETIGTAADLFALGCVLYEMVTGRRAFERDTPAETVAAILQAPAPPLATNLGVPQALTRVIEHCLEKSAGRRFRSAHDVAVALRALLLDSGVSTPVPRRRPAGAAIQHSVAVLPFATTGDVPDLEFLGEGIAESVINTISGVRGLRVIPRSLAFRCAGRESEPRTVGIELNAEALLSGRVTARGDQLHVQADLVDTSDESQIWGGRFVRGLTDLEAVAGAIGDDICDALRGRFQTAVTSTRRSRRPRQRQAPSPAYHEYLRGRALWNKWTRAGLLGSIEAFKAAIDIDASYAPAFGGLADAYAAAAYHGYLASTAVLDLCRDAAQRTIALDASLAEPHATLGVVAMFFEWDWLAAQRHITKALGMNPRCLTAQAYHSLYLASRGQTQAALEAARRAERLDPLSLLAMSAVTWSLLHNGDVEDCEAQLHRILAVDAEFSMALVLLARLAEARRDMVAAVRYSRRWLLSMGAAATQADGLTAAAADGWAAYWRAYLDALDGLAVGGGFSRPVFAAAAHMQLNEPEAALDQLEEAVEARAPTLIFLGTDFRFVTLRGDPRFQAILQRVGLS